MKKCLMLAPQSSGESRIATSSSPSTVHLDEFRQPLARRHCGGEATVGIGSGGPQQGGHID